MGNSEQVIYECGEPRHHCGWCAHYHETEGGCPVMDEPARPFVVDSGRYWHGKGGA